MSSSLFPLENEQAQLPQPFLTGEMLQSPHHAQSSLLDLLKEPHISLVLRSPELNTELLMWPH